MSFQNYFLNWILIKYCAIHMLYRWHLNRDKAVNRLRRCTERLNYVSAVCIAEHSKVNSTLYFLQNPFMRVRIL